MSNDLIELFILYGNSFELGCANFDRIADTSEEVKNFLNFIY